MPRAEHFDDLIAADPKVPSEESEPQTIIDMAWWYKIWQRSCCNLTRARQKLLRRPRRT